MKQGRNAFASFFVVAGTCLLVMRPPSDAAEPLPGVRLPAELARVLTDYEAAWGLRDAARLAGLFAEDGFVLAGGSPPVRGRAAIENYYRGHGGPLALRALAFEERDTIGFIIGAYAREKGEPDEGKFTLTLRKAADGRWLIFSDMDNGNAPWRGAPAAPAALSPPASKDPQGPPPSPSP